ncbi:putative Exopolysaccharide biosynthesis protein [Dehalobacter sp. UNSWDHB]|jgi:Exopolysaccharide biosynthesis protein related to N-acetylglucosamine-1-phosphodiester alpha-N-acetylglucosaminidase|uniref:phosphodiester glycosidase family protein n=1 Tax=unclassified Dehalobacter TaxID=2635733 RepID=UPI00028AAC35|nr:MULTISPECIES: phosphodiester glycosidase family protein [unclassified Dehalobacter]AFV03279.1 Exopolysaccharide biosynthesis protein, putative [Dehalobacter sp. DCA]AFV06265.1 Exopolysaccharide biosynthesis protein, putative [Dehalobacter sp. CF]EQB21040.1 putative Exopolysaccharide biosynthesis protein [Dehalobacter sp. UNSWDHB]
MKKFLAKPYRWAAVLAVLLTFSFVFVLLDTFVIPKNVTEVKQREAAEQQNTSSEQQSAAEDPSESGSETKAAVTDHSYQDENIKITIDTVQAYETTFYVADIRLSDVSYLKTALAENSFGRNLKETTSDMAEEHQAIFAVNGDYYGFRNNGYVLRNGVLYRDTAREAGNDEALVIDDHGNFSIINENAVSADSLTNTWQVLSFGPALIENGEIVVDSTSEVSQSKNSNPRTAIGQVSGLHYIVIVSDGRTEESAGFSLLELAQEFAERGCTIAYNLDGGGSSTMYFNGEIVNHPTDGRSSQQREVSDIVYIGNE